MRRLTPTALAASLLLSLPALAQDQGQDQAAQETATAIFAGGCFWCMEPPYDKLAGVLSTTSGYTGGPEPNPSYEQVSSGRTGHAEAMKVVYDPSRVTYEELLRTFWRNVNPLDAGGQFCDRGSQYRSAIFPQTPAQRDAAERSLAMVQKALDADVKTRIEDAAPFYAAEDYHQDYYEKNPLRYKFYRWNCGRDDRLEDVWGDVPTLALTQ